MPTVITARISISPAYVTREIGRLIAAEDPATTWRSEGGVLTLQREVRGLYLVGSEHPGEVRAREWLDRAQQRADHAEILDAYLDDGTDDADEEWDTYPDDADDEEWDTYPDADGDPGGDSSQDRVMSYPSALIASQAGAYAASLEAACKALTARDGTPTR